MNSTAALSILVLGPIVGATLVALLKRKAVWVVVAAVAGEAVAYTGLAIWSTWIAKSAASGSATYLVANADGGSWVNRFTAVGLLLVYSVLVAGAALIVRRVIHRAARRGPA